MQTTRVDYETAAAEVGVLVRLAAFEPMLIGSPPLGLSVPGSDIDVACTSRSLDEFLDVVQAEYGTYAHFASRIARWLEPHAAVCTFWHRGWTFELFCQTLSLREQVGVRHFELERRLLAIEPALRDVVLAWRYTGLKTEEAFARSLGLRFTDPYRAMLDLEGVQDSELRRLAEASLRRLPPSA